MPGELDNEEDANGQPGTGYYEKRYNSPIPTPDIGYLDRVVKEQRAKVLNKIRGIEQEDRR